MNGGYKIATVFGGTGFIGRHIVQRLTRAGYAVKIATRVPERAYFLKPYGAVGQIVPFVCDYAEPASIAAAVQGADIVVNCIGVLYERRKGGFERAHVAIPQMIAQACAQGGVHAFVHVSALGCDKSSSRYGVSKKKGEEAVLEAFPAAAILRPSVIFGPEDRFFNMFAQMAQILPFLPLIGGGKTKFQPVYVGDVADAVMAAAAREDARGKIFDLGGPEILDFRGIYERLFACTGQRRVLMALPFFVAKIQAFFLQMLPGAPLLTPDQVQSLKTDSVVDPLMPELADLGLMPTGMSLILPTYLEYCRPGGRFGDKIRA